MNQYDQTLERLVKQRANGEALPATVNIHGRIVDTRRFLEGFRFDKREALPTMTAHIVRMERPLTCAHIATMARPLVCEVALSLL
ncbi:hypothetical protein [Bradyrhizobium sp. USDA 3256]